MEGTKCHEGKGDQSGADNQQPPVGMSTGERKPEQPRGDDGNHLREHTGVGGGEEEIDDEVHDNGNGTGDGRFR